MLDVMGRTIDYVRISITDRCNLRCVYCMPEWGVEQYTHADILTYEEILRLVRLMTGFGIRHVRVTGGEPMARKGCLGFIGALNALPGIEGIAMTTNAILLDGKVGEAKRAGLGALNISIDTLDEALFRQMTRGGDVNAVRRVIDDALEAGIRVKLNAVPIGDVNERGLMDLAALAKDAPIDVRFIELMPVGCGEGMRPIPSDDILKMVEERFGNSPRDESRHGYGPARYVKPAGFMGSIGVISPISHEFCDRCNRVRLTSEGFLKLCLNRRDGADLRKMIREGADDDELAAVMRDAILRKPQRHGFHETINDKDDRRMNQIGG